MKRMIPVIPMAVGMAVFLPFSQSIGELTAQEREYNIVHPRATFDGEPFDPIETTVEYEAHPSTQDPSVRVTLEDLRRWETELSNWGRWGTNDQRGTLNYITPRKAQEAAALVEDGVAVSVQHFVQWEPSLESWRFAPAERWHSHMVLDVMSFSTHDGTLSHMDAICHYPGARDSPSRRGEPGEEQVIFNGYPYVVDHFGGCENLSIKQMGSAYVTRGVLYDIAHLRGEDWLEPSTPIYVEDLEEWEEYAGVQVGPGDVLMVRTGRWAKTEAEGAWAYNRGGAGLHASVLPWLHERGVAALVGDAANDVQPSGVDGINRPVHQVGMMVLGLAFVDNGYLENVAREARERDRWEFMLSWQLWPIPGGTASPFNALATF